MGVEFGACENAMVGEAKIRELETCRMKFRTFHYRESSFSCICSELPFWVQKPCNACEESDHGCIIFRLVYAPRQLPISCRVFVLDPNHYHPLFGTAGDSFFSSQLSVVTGVGGNGGSVS